MISHEHKCIFIHVAKCAGTSIEEALGHHSDYSGKNQQDHRTIRGIQKPIPFSSVTSIENILCLAKRLRYPFLEQPNPRNDFTVTAEQYEEYYKFAFVRNPWDRVLSWFLQSKRKTNPDILNSKDIHQQLEGFLQESLGGRHMRSQLFWLKGFDGEIALDFVGRYESLNADFDSVCKRIGLEGVELPHRLKGVRGTEVLYQDYYSEKARHVVDDYFGEEIELFDYAFE